jgi:hypothetical protein
MSFLNWKKVVSDTSIYYLLPPVRTLTFAQLALSRGSDVSNLGASRAMAGVLGAYIINHRDGMITNLSMDSESAAVV